MDYRYISWVATGGDEREEQTRNKTTPKQRRGAEMQTE
jgi:hypothetical protein